MQPPPLFDPASVAGGAGVGGNTSAHSSGSVVSTGANNAAAAAAAAAYNEQLGMRCFAFLDLVRETFLSKPFVYTQILGLLQAHRARELSTHSLNIHIEELLDGYPHLILQYRDIFSPPASSEDTAKTSAPSEQAAEAAAALVQPLLAWLNDIRDLKEFPSILRTIVRELEQANLPAVNSGLGPMLMPFGGMGISGAAPESDALLFEPTSATGSSLSAPNSSSGGAIYGSLVRSLANSLRQQLPQRHYSSLLRVLAPPSD